MRGGGEEEGGGGGGGEKTGDVSRLLMVMPSLIEFQVPNIIRLLNDSKLRWMMTAVYQNNRQRNSKGGAPQYQTAAIN